MEAGCAVHLEEHAAGIAERARGVGGNHVDAREAKAKALDRLGHLVGEPLSYALHGLAVAGATRVGRGLYPYAPVLLWHRAQRHPLGAQREEAVEVRCDRTKSPPAARRRAPTVL